MLKETTITVSAAVVTLIISYLIPLITAIVSKASASATLKQLITAVLAAVTGFLTTAVSLEGTAVFSTQSLLFAIISFATANLGYMSLWKPHSIDQKMLPAQGLGRS